MVKGLQLVVARRYRLRRVLGQGGMGRVWLARDERLQRDVAIKEVQLSPQASPAEQAELCRHLVIEAQAAGQLAHPNVVRVHDLVEWDGRPWIVMEYVASRSLHALIADNGCLGSAYVASIGVAVLDGLTAAHQVGILHRDVTPRNILVGADGRIVLSDFGLATGPAVQRRVAGEVLGTAGYIAPERARHGTSTVEGDLWSLGATLYAAVEGHSPFGRPSVAETLSALMDGWPDPPRRAGALEPVLLGMLVAEPRSRLGAREVRRLLVQASQVEDQPLMPSIEPAPDVRGRGHDPCPDGGLNPPTGPRTRGAN